MRIGSSIGLIALGLILALALNVDVEGIDLELVGWILAVLGVVGLVISVALMRRTRPVVARDDAYPPPADPTYRDPTYRDPTYRDPDARY